MSNNKVIYTCDVSDEGSDMDVSDNDDFLQAAPQPTIPVTQKAVGVFIFFILSTFMKRMYI